MSLTLNLDKISKHLESIETVKLDIVKENIKSFISLLSQKNEKHGLFMTTTLMSCIEDKKLTHEFIQKCIDKHFNLDFGDTSQPDILENVRSFEHKNRIMSFYDLGKDIPSLKGMKIYIETVEYWERTVVQLNTDY